VVRRCNLRPESLGSGSQLQLATDRKRGILERIFRDVRAADSNAVTPSLRRDVGELEEKFLSSRFNLVFLGQFKRGKTTLLNSFLGRELLPTGVLPVTSIVTLVRQGSGQSVEVKFEDGERREVHLDELASYVTERGNPENARHVAEVEIQVSSAILDGNLCLVDTPGIGSIFEQNTRTAYEFVPKADAAIFVFSPESPLNQIELDFLAHLRGYVDKIFFVLNKTDQCSVSDRKELVEFSRAAIRRRVPEGEIRLFAVSARNALAASERAGESGLEASGLPELTDEIREFLSERGGAALVRSAASALARLFGNELLALELQDRAAALPPEELKRRVETIKTVWQGLLVRHREISPILRSEVQGLEESLWRELKEHVESVRHGLKRYMRERLAEQGDVSKGELASRMDGVLRARILEIFDDWRIKEERTIRSAFEFLTTRLSAEAESSVEKIQGAAAREFGFSWKAEGVGHQLQSNSTFSVEIDRQLNWGVGQLPLLLPRFLFVGYLSQRLERSCSHELYRNAGRLREDLGDRLEASAREFLKTLDQYVTQAGDSVMNALDRAAELRVSATVESSRGREALAGRITFLQQMREQLSENFGE
jgi:GTPase SAR1 family protein